MCFLLEDFKQLSKTSILALLANMDRRLATLGIDVALGRVDGADHQEAVAKLTQESQNRLKIMSKSKKHEFLALLSGLKQHLDKECPMPVVYRHESIPVEREQDTLSTGWSFGISTPTSAPVKQTNFSPLTHGLKRGISRELEIRRTSTAIEPLQDACDAALHPERQRCAWSIAHAHLDAFV